MNRNETVARDEAGWNHVQWNARRVRLAGGGAVVGGLVGLLISGLVEVPIGRLGSNSDFGLFGFVYPVIYLLFVGSLIAAAGRFDTGTGSGERSVALLLAAAIGTYAGSLLVIMAGHTLFEEIFIPAGIVTGFAYLAVRFLGTLYGLRLWKHGRSSRLTAGLFLALFPALFILGLLTTVGVPPSVIEVVVYVAFIALGVELVRSEAGTPALLVWLVVGVVSRLSTALKLVPLGMYGLIVVQYATANLPGSVVAAFHPVNALVMFLVVLVALHRAWRQAQGSASDQHPS